MANGTALTQEELYKLGQGAQQFKAGLTPAPTLQKPMVGPIQPGSTRPTVDVPNPAMTPAPPSAPQNGTLQGPYPVKDANGQTTYQAGMNVVNGAMAPNPPTPQGGMTPAPPQGGGNGLYQDQYARTPDQIAKLAKERIDKILQAGRTSAQGSLTGAKNVYDYENQITGDNRTLRNADFKETNNPFSGKFAYDKTNMLRNDNIQDTSHDKDYQANVGLINQKLADLEAAAPGDEQDIIDQLQQIERQTGINVAQLQEQQKQNQLGQSNADRTFNYNVGQDKIQNDRNATNDAISNYGQTLTNQLNELKLGNYPTELKQQAALFEQEFKKGNLTNEALEYNLKQAKDPNSPTNLAAKIDLQLKQLDLKNAPEKAKLEITQLQKQIAEIGKVHYKLQTPAEIAQDEVTLAVAKKQMLDIAAGKYPGDKATTEKPPTVTQENNQFTADIYTNVDKMDVATRAKFFANEKSKIIAKLGKSGYDSAYGTYFNEDGTPK